MMKRIYAALVAALFATAAYGQSAPVTNHAFAIGKGPNVQGYTSLLCAAAQLAVGQAGADPICRTVSGDATLSAAGALTLATVLGTPGSFGNASQCVTVTANAKGLITAISQQACAGGGGGTPGGTSGQFQYNNAGAFGGFTASGDLTANTSTGVFTFGTVNANVGTFGSATQCATVTVNAKGLVTAASQNLCTPAIASVTGLGTGVGAALAVNIGSAGAPVLFNGAGGTPSSITLTNGGGLPTTGLTGTLQAAQEPAHTGDVTNTAGSLAMSLAAVNANVGTFGSSTNCVTFTVNAKGLITAASQTACAGGGTGTVTNQTNTASGGLVTSGNCANTTTNAGSPCNYALTAARQTLPLTTAYGSGSGTHTMQANVLWAEIELYGGGGGGGGGGTGAPTSGGAGGNTCWNTTGAACTTPVYQAGGGAGGINGGVAPANGGAGGAASGSSTCSMPISGSDGAGGNTSIAGSIGAPGGHGGASSLGGAGGNAFATAGGAGKNQTGGGGAGGGVTNAATANGGGGGGSGATCRVIINSPASTYTYAVGAAGAVGTAGTGGFAGGVGGLGFIRVIEHFGT